jgi:hypothetical protein
VNGQVVNIRFQQKTFGSSVEKHGEIRILNLEDRIQEYSAFAQALVPKARFKIALGIRVPNGASAESAVQLLSLERHPVVSILSLAFSAKRFLFLFVGLRPRLS